MRSWKSGKTMEDDASDVLWKKIIRSTRERWMLAQVNTHNDVKERAQDECYTHGAHVAGVGYTGIIFFRFGLGPIIPGSRGASAPCFVSGNNSISSSTFTSCATGSSSLFFRLDLRVDGMIDVSRWIRKCHWGKSFSHHFWYIFFLSRFQRLSQ